MKVGNREGEDTCQHAL